MARKMEGIPEREDLWEGWQAHNIHAQAAAQCVSLRRNMLWLSTYQGYPRLSMQIINNAMEGVFTDIKTKLRVYSGITKMRRMVLIQES